MKLGRFLVFNTLEHFKLNCSLNAGKAALPRRHGEAAASPYRGYSFHEIALAFSLHNSGHEGLVPGISGRYFSRRTGTTSFVAAGALWISAGAGAHRLQDIPQVFDRRTNIGLLALDLEVTQRQECIQDFQLGCDLLLKIVARQRVGWAALLKFNPFD
jgi:hypothetical protein